MTPATASPSASAQLHGRRRFLRRASAAAATGLVLPAIAGPLHGVANAKQTEQGGSDLSGWETVVGDGVWTGPGQGAVTATDIAADHLGDRTTLRANTGSRGVMAHNITFLRHTDLQDIDRSQRVSAQVRLPRIPTMNDWDWNIQTVEMGLFIWDGRDTRVDHGVAVQWVLNPWDPSAGTLRVWDQTPNGPRWSPVSYLAPDTRWHEFELRHRAGSNNAMLTVDGKNIPIDKTITQKQDSWGDTIDARFQLELISVWPGDHSSVPPASVDWRDWAWTENS